MENNEVESVDTGMETTDTGYESSGDETQYDYQNYTEDNFDVPTGENEYDKFVEDDQEYDPEALNDMMMEYMRENYEIPDKFKDIGSLINSYKHLESRMGSMKGAPETYELDEQIFDAFDTDMLQDVTSIAREMGIDNDGVNALLGKALEAQNRIAEANWEMELNKLGPNAREQVAKDIQYLNANFSPEMAETLQGMVQTADQYQALQSLIMDHRMGGNPAPAAATPSQAPVTQAQIDSMLFAKDEFGNLKMETDSAYQQKVMGMMNSLHGGY